MKKNKIDGVVVVEGKTDKDKLLKLFDVSVITTNGSAINKQTIELIKRASVNNKVILFLDPDYVGESIRKAIIKALPEINFYNCFVDPKDMMLNKKKIGVAETTDEAIINAFNNLISFKSNNNSLLLTEFNSLGINKKELRLRICNHFNISYCNNKQLFKRLNMMNVNYAMIKKVVDNE